MRGRDSRVLESVRNAIRLLPEDQELKAAIAEFEAERRCDRLGRAWARISYVLSFLSTAGLVLLLQACESPSRPAPPPPEPGVTGAWTGRGDWGYGLPTPLEMTLRDASGTINGEGGGGDCRYFVLCGSFYSYTVGGNHANLAIVIEGTSANGRRWTLRGTLASDGSTMSGTGSGDEFAFGPWQMSRRP